MRDSSASDVLMLAARLADLQERLAAVERSVHRHSTTGGLVDHGGLGGLADNDHPQYSLVGHGHGTLLTPRAFSLSGDVTAPAVNFDGSAAVNLVAAIANGSITQAMLSAAAGEIGAAAASYTPTFSASTPPVLGTGGTATGIYLKMGKMRFVRGDIQFGTSGASAGVGGYTFGLPDAARASGAPSFLCVGAIRIDKLSGASPRASFFEPLVANGSSTVQYRYVSAWPVGNDVTVGASNPAAPTINNATLANNGRYSFAVLYEAA